jgi:subtilase family serine protease
MQYLGLLGLAMTASVLLAQPAQEPPRRVFPVRSSVGANGVWEARPPLWTRGRYLSTPKTTTTGAPYVTPSQMQSIYGVYTTDYPSTIAIVDAYDSPNAEADLGVFSSTYGLSPCTTANGCFTKVNERGAKVYPVRNSGWESEINLDTQWVHAMAPDANILLVEANSASYADLFTAVNYAKQHASVVSMSWGGSEMSGQGLYDTTVFSQAGVTFVAASGDSDASVEYPASSANVIAVGGTSFALNSKGYVILPVIQSAWTDKYGGSGGGCSAYTPQPAFQKTWVPSSCAMRGVPDLALDADPASGVPVYISRQGGWWIYGGTSLSCQLFAGILADMNGYRISTYYKSAQAPLSTALADLYSAAGVSYATYFLDITSGGGPDSAGPRWDFVTGLGSPTSSLMNYLESASK